MRFMRRDEEEGTTDASSTDASITTGTIDASSTDANTTTGTTDASSVPGWLSGGWRDDEGGARQQNHQGSSEDVSVWDVS